MEVRRLKRLKANMNERKRSQGINDCIKEQATRLRKYTDLDVGKLGKVYNIFEAPFYMTALLCS